jgi:branched-chain amino acid aminotransferase
LSKVFLNEGLIDSSAACILASDGGFLYGSGLFETMRCNKGVVFCLEDHLDRLFASAEKLFIRNDYGKKYIHDAVYAVLEANALVNARLRLTLTSGAMSADETNRKSTLLIAATELQDYPAQYYQKGIITVLCPFRQNTTEPTCGHKTTSYFSRMLALKDAQAKGAAEALWFTTDGRLAEGCISNVFIVKNSSLLTPTLSTPVLPGIARKAVSELAGKNSIQLIEKDLSIDDLLGADEVFLTNVIMKVMPAVGIENHVIGNGKVGAMAKNLLTLFDDYIA